MKSQTAESGQDQVVGRKASSDSDMQGQLKHHENQVSSRDSSSTTAAMDDPASALVPTTTAPQIRSRITVVCAECKRLKLKCDRRTPCGSCTKRDTVARCIYSPAAAEKVDLHSINNRLIQVETLLSMITAGRTPPPFQSSYPLAQIPIGSLPARPSHVVSDTVSPISIRMHDLVNIWLVHCQLDVFTPGNQVSLKSEALEDGPFVKLEPSLELLHFSSSGQFHEDTILIDQGPSASPNHAPATRRTLPSLHLYHTQRPQESSYLSQDPYSCEYTASQGVLSPAPLSGQPSLTSAIFAHLPPPSVRTRLLTNVRSATPHLSLLIHWARVVELADAEIAAAQAEKEPQRSLANAVFDARAGSNSPSPLSLPSSNSAASLPLFACMCYLLALGAVESPGEASVDHSFLYGLARQAIGVWEEHRSSPGAKEEETCLDSVDVSVDASKAKQAEKEKNELDHMVALLLQVKYLLRTGSATSSRVLSETVFPLIGKLVNTARGLELARDPESETGVRKHGKAEERRRNIWWDIMFYDIFTSDVLEQTPLIASHSYKTKIPAVAHSPSRPSSSRKQSDESADGDDESDPSGDRGNEDERRPLFAKANGLSKARIPPRPIPPPKTKTKTKASSSIPDDAETGFFGVRCRLTRLAQTLKHRLAHPGCDCYTCGSGYTLDQAVKLEAEIRTWAADLPSSLRLEPSPSTETKSQKHTAIAAELAILANRMIISAYVPLMRPPQDGTTSSSTSVYSAAHPWSPASRATVDAAQAVVRAARVLHRLVQTGNRASFMCGFYPLQKAVADALVICAHSGFASTKPRRTVALVEEVSVALEVLCGIGFPDGEMSRLLASMKRRIESSDVCRKGEENPLKRKHAVLEVLQPVERRAETNGQMEVTPMAVGSDSSFVKANVNHSSASQQPQVHRPVIPPSPPRQSSVPRGSKGSDKRHSKKSSYPTVGFRDRGKDSAPWMIKKVNGPKTESIPEPRVADFTSSPVQEGHPNNFQSQQLSPIQHPVSHPIVDNGYRSRSSSVTRTSRLQAGEYPLRYAEERDEDIHISQRRRFSINDAGQRQPHQPEQVQQPFISTQYIRSRSSSRPGPHEGPRSYDQTPRSFDQGSTSSDGAYGGPSSPHANSSSGPLSTASSPYGSTTGHPQTPVIYPSNNSHHPSPPAFVHQLTVSGPETYYHLSSGYETPYESQEPQQQQVVGASTMDSPIPVQSQIPTVAGEAIVNQVSQSLPVYEKTRHQILYDVKTPAELVQHQMHHYQIASGRGTPDGHLSMTVSTPQGWPPTQYISPQQPLVEQDSQYWSMSQTYYS
ncbi:hypothetical protein C0995_010124 [Termitomyces sp. Mi166|nr:hypothetical protein C0995_010124 [Termitomyces sp. Mi166\